MSLSDLDLVQQAMAPTEPGATAQSAQAQATTNGSDALADIDMSKLTEGDRKALQPILDALRAASGKEGEEGGEVDVEGILKQLEAADNVADTLEGRLDSLLANLGELEQDAEQKAREAKEAK